MTRHIEVSFSKDGGKTFSDWRKRPVPDWGDYSDPMPVFRRNGQARQFQWRFRYTEPSVITFISQEVEAE